MERFNLNTWLQDKSRKVIDDDGFPVEIIKWDANEKCPVVYLNHNGIAYNVSVDGMYDSDPNHGLFFAEDEPNEPYNPYKVAVESILKMAEKYEPYCRVDIDSALPDFLNNVKVKCKDAIEYEQLHPEETEYISKEEHEKILEQVYKEHDEDLEQAYKNADKVQFNRGMDEVLTNPQKYFHLGDTIRPKNSTAEYTIVSIFNGRYYGDGWSLGIQEAADHYELVKEQDCDLEDTINKKQQWTTEDTKRIQRIHDFIWKNRKGDTDEIFQQEQDANWLMTFVPQPKQELTEEDKEVLNTIIFDVTRWKQVCGVGTDEYNIRIKALDFLKSIKDKPKQ